MNEKQKINYDSYIPYYIQLIEALEEKIQVEDMKPGDQLPSELDMCELYGISRTVVRQALRKLELQGLVIRRKGKGTFVAQPKISESLVQRLTGFYQDMVERGYVPVTRVLRLDVIPASSNVAKHLEIEPGTEVYALERLRLVDDEPNHLVSTYISCKLAPDLDKHDVENQSLYAILEGVYGFVLARGKRTIGAVTVNRREAKLLHVEQGAPMILLDSVTYLDDGTPIEYYHAIHRGDQTRFEVELVRIPGQQTLEKAMKAQEIQLPRSN